MVVIVGLWLTGGAAAAEAANCTQTLHPGDNLASAIAIAAAGSTICLNPGDDGVVDLTGLKKTSDVTITSASGSFTASLRPTGW